MTKRHGVSETNDCAELERRLAHVRRLSNTAQDPLTQQRMAAMAVDIDLQLAGARVRDGEA